MGHLDFEVKRFGMVSPAILGLSPTSSGGKLTGEVIREFTHAITGDDMLIMDFSSVIGEHTVDKKHCTMEGSDGASPSKAGGSRSGGCVSPLAWTLERQSDGYSRSFRPVMKVKQV